MTVESDVFPTAAELELDVWTAGGINRDHSRWITGAGETGICLVGGDAMVDPIRDTTTRRIEMLGELYESLARAVAKMQAAGMDCDAERAVLGDFVAPKPFPEGRG